MQKKDILQHFISMHLTERTHTVKEITLHNPSNIFPLIAFKEGQKFLKLFVFKLFLLKSHFNSYTMPILELN
jgi:hypothetical protein